jgi:type 1 fimbria pilin
MFMKKALADRTLFKSGASVITQLKSILLTAIVGSLAAGAVQASTSANLEVSGRLVPAACAISLGNKGVFDLGITPAGMISRTATTLLPPLITTLTIRCPQETFVSLDMQDLAEGTQVSLALPSFSGSTGDAHLASNGLGLSAEGAKIGAYMVELDGENFTEEGESIGVLYSEGPRWESSPYSYRFLKSGRHYSFGNTRGRLPVKDVQGALRVSAGVAHDQGLVFRDVVEFNGRAVLRLNYL